MTLLEKPDFKALERFAKGVVSEIVTGDYRDNADNEHWAFEAIMEAFYGPQFWDWFDDNT